MTDRSSPVTEPEVLLKAHGICKAFPGVRALNKAQITVRRGRLNALLGENGAGKTTLMNILSGVFPPDAGEILLNGQSITFRKPHEAQQAGIATIYQELNLIPDLSVAENIFLGHEPRNRLGLIDFPKMHTEALTAPSQLGVDIDPRSRVSRLRVGQQQVIEIAKAISYDSRVIIMDEPTSAISDQEVNSLFRLIHQLKRRGIGIIYITHKLDELTHIADEITVFRDGQFIAEKPFQDVTHDEIVKMMVGREVTEITRATTKPGAEVLRVSSLSLPRPERANEYAVCNVSFAVNRGEILGLFGVMGAGRTELLQTIFGLHYHSSLGEILVSGNPVTIRSPAEAILAGIALAPEDRKAEGLVLPMSVGENISLSCLQLVARFGILRPRPERNLAATYIDRLRVKTSSLNQRVRNLSGGNQQKLVVSKWLATRPKILLLDEPTRGIDVKAKREIYALIDELASDGLGIVMASSEMPEILSLADRILVLADGRITAEFARGEATEESLLQAALPRGKTQKAKSA
jgi:ribose transport system ATP-binding protein